jgi:hypothetical protein
VLATLAGCGPSIVMHPPGADIVPKRLGALPTQGVEWEFDFDGNRTLQRAWTVAARTSLDDATNYQLSLHGGSFFEEDALGGLPAYERFRRWSESTLLEIMGEALGRSRDRHESVLAWGFASNLEPWRQALASDFVLISLFLDGHNSTGRALAVAFAGGKLAAQRAIACVVRLSDGRVVWCQLMEIGRWNIRKRAGAQQVVAALLEEMLAQGDRLLVRPPPVSRAPLPGSPAASPTPPPSAKAPPPAPPVDQAADTDETK